MEEDWGRWIKLIASCEVSYSSWNAVQIGWSFDFVSRWKTWREICCIMIQGKAILSLDCLAQCREWIRWWIGEQLRVPWIVVIACFNIGQLRYWDHHIFSENVKEIYSSWKWKSGTGCRPGGCTTQLLSTIWMHLLWIKMQEDCNHFLGMSW